MVNTFKPPTQTTNSVRRSQGILTLNAPMSPRLAKEFRLQFAEMVRGTSSPLIQPDPDWVQYLTPFECEIVKGTPFDWRLT